MDDILYHPPIEINVTNSIYLFSILIVFYIKWSDCNNKTSLFWAMCVMGSERKRACQIALWNKKKNIKILKPQNVLEFYFWTPSPSAQQKKKKISTSNAFCMYGKWKCVPKITLNAILIYWIKENVMKIELLKDVENLTMITKTKFTDFIWFYTVC